MNQAARFASRASGSQGAIELPDFKLVDADKDHAKATAFNMLFMVWRYETRPGAYRRGIRLAEELGAKFAGGIGIAQVVEMEAVPPSAETRKIFIDLWRQAPVKHYSVTHEGTGFKAASVRAVVGTVHALGCRNCEHAVHKSIRQAAEWHARQQALIGRTESAEMIELALRKLRSEHRERFP